MAFITYRFIDKELERDTLAYVNLVLINIFFQNCNETDIWNKHCLGNLAEYTAGYVRSTSRYSYKIHFEEYRVGKKSFYHYTYLMSFGIVSSCTSVGFTQFWLYCFATLGQHIQDYAHFVTVSFIYTYKPSELHSRHFDSKKAGSSAQTILLLYSAIPRRIPIPSLTRYQCNGAQNLKGDLEYFNCATISGHHKIFLCGLVVRVSGYRCRDPGIDCRRFQISWEGAGLERGPLRLVRTTVELLGRKRRGSGLENRD
jgi:hypothetical protein